MADFAKRPEVTVSTMVRYYSWNFGDLVLRSVGTKIK
jgi:hypothetical protein